MPHPHAIAVIDDDEMVCTSLSRLIRSLDLSARTFSSADAFLASGETAFTCVISDVQMPGTSGLLLQQIVSDWNDPPLMIVMSGHPQGMRLAALEGGAACYLEKPVDGDLLISCLEKLLGPLP